MGKDDRDPGLAGYYVLLVAGTEGLLCVGIVSASRRELYAALQLFFTVRIAYAF